MEMDKKKALALLKQTLIEIPKLRKLHYNNQEFKLWLHQVETIIKHGLDADDYNTFLSVQDKYFLDDIGIDLAIEQEEDYSKRLQDCETVILAIIKKYEILGIEEMPAAIGKPEEVSGDGEEGIVMEKTKSMFKKLSHFYLNLKNYQAYRINSVTKGIAGTAQRQMLSLREKLVRERGKFEQLTTELTGSPIIDTVGKGPEYSFNMWTSGLNPNYTKRAEVALGILIDTVHQAIGTFELDIEKGIRDKETGKLIEKPKIIKTIPPKAFIVHGGKSEARDKLHRFLIALGIMPLIIEEEPREGRSLNEQVEYYSEQADCAIILGTADDKELKDGKLYPRRNVYIEIGRFQEKFSNRIIYLLEEGASFPSDISEKLYTRFIQESMDEAFISVARELKAFRILKAVKPQVEEKP